MSHNEDTVARPHTLHLQEIPLQCFFCLEGHERYVQSSHFISTRFVQSHACLRGTRAHTCDCRMNIEYCSALQRRDSSCSPLAVFAPAAAAGMPSCLAPLETSASEGCFVCSRPFTELASVVESARAASSAGVSSARARSFRSCWRK